MDALIVDLEENNEDARVAEIEAMVENVKVEMNQNQRAIKEKMEKIIADNLAARPLLLLTRK